MTREKAKKILYVIDKRYCTLTPDERQAIAMAISALEQEPCDAISRGWVPLTTRHMTEDEMVTYAEQLEYCDDAVIYTCALPDDGEEVLITTCTGYVLIDTFSYDPCEGCGFEGYDIEDVKAWMPLQKPYEEGQNDT